MALSSLHIAIWNGDLDALESILSMNEFDIEEVDPAGDSPLMLALRCSGPSQQRIVELLLKHGANTHVRDRLGWNCAQNATLCDDDKLLSALYMQSERQTYEHLSSRIEILFDAFSSMPDFYMELSFEAKSWVPLVSTILPSDVLYIWKRGSNLRCDFTITGFDGFKWIKGKSSQIFCGRDSENPGSLFLLNHEEKTVYDMTSSLKSPTLSDVDAGLHLLYTTQLSTSALDASEVTFIPSKTKTKSKVFGTEVASYVMKDLNLSVSIRPPVNRFWKRHGYARNDKRLERAQSFLDGIKKNSKRDITKKEKKKNGWFNIFKRRKDDLQKACIAATQSMEMHLDALSGDEISWVYYTRSQHILFEAKTQGKEDDESLTVYEENGFSKEYISNSIKVDKDGVVILVWKNTKQDLKSRPVKMYFGVSHSRPVSDSNSDSSVGTNPPAAPIESSTCQRKETDEDQSPDNENSDDEFSSSNEEEEEEEGFSKLLRRGSLLDIDPSSIINDVPEEKVDNEENSAACIPQLFERKNYVPSPSITVESFNDHYKETTYCKDSGLELKPKTICSLVTMPPIKKVRKSLEAKIQMAEGFPFTVQQFLPVIDFLSRTGEHTKSLEEFFSLKLPSGFPVEFEIPLVLTIRGAYQFQHIELGEIHASRFVLPEHYTPATSK